MNNNVLYLVVGGLAVAVVALGYEFYQQGQTPAAVQTTISTPLHGDHRGHDYNRDRGDAGHHDNNHSAEHDNHEPNGHAPNE